MAQRIRLLALDIDGTLTPGNNVYSQATRNAVQAARAAGIEVMLATSRRYRTTRIAIDALAISAHAVCLGGALTKHAQQNTVATSAIAIESARVLIAAARLRGLPMILQRDRPLAENRDFVIDNVVSWNDDTRHYFHLGAAHGEADDALAMLDTTAPLTMGIYGDYQVLADFSAAIPNILDEAQLAGVVTHLVPAHITAGAYLEIIATAVSKWTGVAALAAHFGITNAEICAIGDERNDLPMLRHAGLAIAMGNAPPDVQAACHWVTDDVANDGAARAIERLLSQ